MPAGEKPPLTGRRQQLVRAYQLLVQKSDQEYLQEARRAFMPEPGGGEKAFLPEPADASWRDEVWGEPDAKQLARQGKKRRIIVLLAAACLVICCLRLALGPAILTADISVYADVPITIEGLTEEPFEITAADLSKMKLDRIRVDVHESELVPGQLPELGKAVGPSLETFLKHYGTSLDEIRSMKVYTETDRGTAYVHSLQDSRILLSIANGHQALGEKQAPLRIAVENAGADEWAGWIRRIVFTKKGGN